MVTRGDLTCGIPLLEETVRVARDADLPDTLSSATIALGQALVLAGRVSEGVALLEQVVADDVRRGVAHASCMLRLGEGYLRAGRADEALDRATRALELARTNGERAGEAWATWLLGEIADGTPPADPVRAEAHYRGALTVARELGMRPLVARCHVGLARLGAHRGQPEEAETHLETATRLFTEMGMVRWRPEEDEIRPRSESGPRPSPRDIPRP